MAEFNPAYEAMILDEGGYTLTDVKGDKGGQTYAGISRRSWPSWAGWADIDAGRTPVAQSVRDFYKGVFWDVIQGDNITSQAVATTLFNFAVNAGVGTATKLAQLVVGTTPDGRLGPVTLERLNSVDADTFLSHYALTKIARYRDICMKDRTQVKFLLGWINRTLKGL